MNRQNLSLKAVALLIAVLLTYAVHSAGNERVISLFVPVELKNAPEDKVLVRSSKKGVQVTLKGPSFLIKSVASSPPPLTASLPDNPGEKITVSFKATDLALPRSVEVESIEPAQMEFSFEALERREVKIEVPRLGQLHSHLTLEAIEVLPKTVMVKGPRSDVRQLKSVETEPVNLSEIGESMELPLLLRALSPSITIAVKSVSAKIVVGQVPSRQEFKELSVELRTPKGIGNIRLTPPVVAVAVSGSSEALSKISASNVVPFIRISEAPARGPTMIKVQVDVPEGVKVVSVEPTSVLIERESQGRRGVKHDSR